MRQMTDHILEIIKGPNPMLGPIVDYQAKFNATQVSTITGGVIFAGRCVSLSASGEFVLGVGATNAALSVPMFLRSNSDDYDVKNDGGNLASDYGAWSPGMPTGKAQAVVAMFAGELETTEFIDSLNYAYNQALTAPNSPTDASGLLNTAGKLTNASVKPYQNVVVGYVSLPFTAASPRLNAHGKKVLRFWSTFLPKLDTATAITYN